MKNKNISKIFFLAFFLTGALSFVSLESISAPNEKTSSSARFTKTDNASSSSSENKKIIAKSPPIKPLFNAPSTKILTSNSNNHPVLAVSTLASIPRGQVASIIHSKEATPSNTPSLSLNKGQINQLPNNRNLVSFPLNNNGNRVWVSTNQDVTYAEQHMNFMNYHDMERRGMYGRPLPSESSYQVVTINKMSGVIAPYDPKNPPSSNEVFYGVERIS